MTIDAQILRALRQAGEGAVSGTELSQTLGISRAAIWARIEELRTLGYDISAAIDSTRYIGSDCGPYKLNDIPEFPFDDVFERWTKL